ncbi:MAG: hypothetical protein H6527_02565 [Actinobacteria bacterium]|nr:hypothetical protein [Actinomycetota bacterium]
MPVFDRESIHANQAWPWRFSSGRYGHRELTLHRSADGLSGDLGVHAIQFFIVAPETVAAALAAHREARAVFVGDPSYVGTVGDVRGLTEVAHAHDVPLIVDAAWAAHFGFHPDLPPHPLQCGADAMVTSAHKTLPAWSQAALVLARTERIDPARLDAGVEATATTSPAGAILASTDASRALLERDGRELLAEAIAATRAARERLKRVEGLTVLDGPSVDPVKLTLVLSGTGADGNAVERDLIAAGMPVESADRDVLTAIVTLADSDEALARLADHLAASIQRHRGDPRPPVGPAAYSVEPIVVVPPREAFFAAAKPVGIDEAVGRVSAELIAPYPPGIPVLAPGEEVTAAVIEALASACAAGGDRGGRPHQFTIRSTVVGLNGKQRLPKPDS